MPLCLSYLYFYSSVEDNTIYSLGLLGIMIITSSVGFAAGILFLITPKFFLKKRQDKKSITQYEGENVVADSIFYSEQLWEDPSNKLGYKITVKLNDDLSDYWMDTLFLHRANT